MHACMHAWLTSSWREMGEVSSRCTGSPAHGGAGISKSGTFRRRSTHLPSTSVGGPLRRGEDTSRSPGHDNSPACGLNRPCNKWLGLQFQNSQSVDWPPFEAENYRIFGELPSQSWYMTHCSRYCTEGNPSVIF
jgi:hypothetical protein